MNLNHKNLLITGGTGSLGKKLTKRLLLNWPHINRLVIFSRDEQKQFVMAQEFSNDEYPCMRYFLGDVRDKERLIRATEGIDVVIHAAAMKHVHLAEYNPDEAVKTNVIGAQNVIGACLINNVQSVVALSTDKACAPINLYGATKLASDKLFVAANNIKGNRDMVFSVVRYGNVMGSNGSVIPFFQKKSKEGILPITNEGMTRFNISLDGGVDMVFHAIEHALGGEIFVPKIPSYRILDLAKAVAPNCQTEVIGIRPGEKLHEEMITASDSYNTWDLGSYYVILPPKTAFELNEFVEKFQAIKVPEGFEYNSATNPEWETIETLKEKIQKYLS